MLNTTPFYTRLAHILICIFGLFYLAIIGETILAPLLFALVFSLLLLPYANLLEKRFRIKRAFACIIVIVSLIVVLSSLILLLFDQLGSLTADIPAFKQHMLVAIEDIQQWVARTFHINTSKQISYINSTANSALSKGTGIIGNTLLSASSILFFLLFIFLYTFFILLHRRHLLRFVVSLFADAHTETVNKVVSEIRYIIKKYISGILIEMLIVTTLACIAFEIIGIKYALLLGLITGIFNLIPYVGIFSALLLNCLVTFATTGSADVLFVLISVFLIHLVDANYIMPKMVGSKVKINPLVALLGLVIGEMVWGIKGMFLSIPIIAVFKVIFDHVEGLRSWGLLLGEEEAVEVVVKVKKGKKKIVTEEESRR
jgi:putative permease